MTEKFRQWFVSGRASALALIIFSSCSTTESHAIDAEVSASPSPLAAAPSPSASVVASPVAAASEADGYASPDLTPPPSITHEAKEAGLQLEVTPKEAPDGGVIFVRIKTDPAKHASVKEEQVGVIFDAIKYPAFKTGENEFGSLIAVHFNSKPRKTKLEIELPGTPKAELSYEIVDGKYRSEVLTVDPKFSSPPKKELKRIVREMKEIGAIYRKTSNERLWSGRFALPIESVMTSPFGNKRVFNGQLKGFHQGLDLRARTPTPIVAPEGGKVVLAKGLYYTGNCVILDHGHGLYTLYAHMSRIKVKKGQMVKKGELLGLSGATGRISGPHLHWGAVLKGAKVNPLDLAKVIP